MKLNNLLKQAKPYLQRFWQGLELYDTKFFIFMIFMKVFHFHSWMLIAYPALILVVILAYTFFPKHLSIND